MDKELIAHELWAAAQLTPGEGIEDGAGRIADILARIGAERSVLKAQSIKQEKVTAFFNTNAHLEAKVSMLQAKVAQQAALIEQCEKVLIESRDDVESELIRSKEFAGYKRYDDEVKRQMDQLVRHDKTLAAIEAYKLKE